MKPIPQTADSPKTFRIGVSASIRLPKAIIVARVLAIIGTEVEVRAALASSFELADSPFR